MKQCSEFRAKRMCLSISGGQLWLLALSLALAALCVPSSDAVPARTSDEMYAKLDGADEYADVDNVEWHHVKVVDGLLEEDHPIIMYKEDFVSEDFDPAKNRSSSGASSRHPPRKYKDISHRRRTRLRHTNSDKDPSTSAMVTEKYRALKPQKVLFDVLPQAPLLTAADEGKLDASNLRVEVLPLTDDDNTNGNAEPASLDGGDEVSKQALSKRPKKYHRRARRQATDAGAVAVGDEHVRGKRNPYYRRNYQNANSVLASAGGNNWVLVPVVSPQQGVALRQSVRGKLWNGLYLEVPSATSAPRPAENGDDADVQFGPRFGGPNNTDRVVIPSDDTNTNVVSDITTRPPRRRRPISIDELFHDSNPANADTSFATEGRRVPQQSARRQQQLAQSIQLLQAQQEPQQQQQQNNFGSRFAGGVDRVVWN